MSASVEVRAQWLFAAVLLLVAAGAGGWLLFDQVRDTTYEIRTHDAVSGLLPGAPVEFHGVEVGKVRAVDLLQPRLVRVLVQVRRGVPVTSATVATITGRGMAARGFTGYVYVSLEDSDRVAQPLAKVDGDAYALLASAPANIVSLDTTVNDLSRNVQQVTTTLEAALDPKTIVSLKQSLSDLERVTHTLAANNERMERILANAERASARVQPLLTDSERAVGTLQSRVLPQAQASLVRLDQLSAHADARLTPLLDTSNEAVLMLHTQLLPEAQRALTHVDQLSTALGDTVVRVRRNPAVLVRGTGPAPSGPGEGP